MAQTVWMQKHRPIPAHVDETYEPAGEPIPTDHAPGTLGKIEEMRQRVERGESLFSALDRGDCEGLADGQELPRLVNAPRSVYCREAIGVYIERRLRGGEE